MFLFDGNNTKDQCKLVNTDIQIFIEGTDELVFRGSNKVVLAGAGFSARKHFNITSPEITPSYNTKLELENTDNSGSGSSNSKVYLFAVGTDGCGTENSQVYPVDYRSWIGTDALVPFRYVTTDLGGDLRNKYFGRKEVSGGYFAYYFKAFENNPTLVQRFVDGTIIDSGVYENSNTNDVETYVELNLKITKEDCREFFISKDGINDARVNTISLLTAWPKVVNGITYYQDIRPLTKLNFPNESLIDSTKGLDIIYHIYY